MTLARTLTRVLPCLTLALVLACAAGKNQDASTAPEPSAASASEPEAPNSGGAKWRAWRWQGQRDNCFFIVGNRCFDSKQAACKAAKCRPGACATEGAAPATVSCGG